MATRKPTTPEAPPKAAPATAAAPAAAAAPAGTMQGATLGVAGTGPAADQDQAPKAPPAARAAEPATKAIYDVISTLEHDLVRYEIGAQVELTEAQAKPLLGHTVRLAKADQADAAQAAGADQV